MSEPIEWMTASDLSEAYRNGSLDPVQVTTYLLDRIERLDERFNGFCLIDRAGALEAAEQSSARHKDGAPLHALDGVPVAHKDLMLTVGQPTLRGSTTIDPAGPWLEDAPSTARLKEVGAVIVGKTTTPEFGWKGVTDSKLCGITRNPWDASKTTGGSSGGSASALAAGMVPLASGTDGGGSIRIPAGFCGLAGLKPSYGRVPAFPLSPFGTVAHVGPMARSVKDLALFMDVLTRPDSRDWYHLPPAQWDWSTACDGGLNGLTLAVSADLGFADLDADVAQAFGESLRVLESKGAKLVDAEMPFDDPVEIFQVLWHAGAAFLLGELPDEKKQALDPGLQRVVAHGESLSLRDYQSAVKAREQLGSAMRAFMLDFDALITPTLPIPAFEAGFNAPNDQHGDWEGWTPFSYPFNLTQQPAACVPNGFTKSGLPTSLHIVAPQYRDDLALRIAGGFEAATDWHKHHPKLD